MLIDLDTVRLRERRDGIPCFTMHEPAPSNVAHMIHPNHPDYEAARRMHEAMAPEPATAVLPSAGEDARKAENHRPDGVA